MLWGSGHAKVVEGRGGARRIDQVINGSYSDVANLSLPYFLIFLCFFFNGFGSILGGFGVRFGVNF